MPLDPPARLGYSDPAPTAVGDRRGNRKNCKARSALNRRFFCGRFTVNGGWRGATSGLAGILTGRHFHPREPSAARLVERTAADSRTVRSSA
jgi:hypothetical protein